MTAPAYLLEKIARHGEASARLKRELESRAGEFADMPMPTAVAFDAADFVWSFLCLQGIEHAQESRELRNRVAEAIISALEHYDLGERR